MEEAPQTKSAALAVAAELRKADQPVERSVRSLRDEFGFRRLTDRARRQIIDALAEHGIEATPGLEYASLDTQVRLVRRAPDSTSQQRRGLRLRRRAPSWGRRFEVIVSVVASIIGIGVFVVPMFENEPPGPALGGDLNVAIAGLTAEDSEDSQAASGLSESIYDAVAARADRDKELQLDIAPPDEVGVIDGDTVEERAERARERADELNADVVLYGLVTSSDEGTRIEPAFYVRGDKLEGAEELVGSHRLGDPIGAAGNLAESIPTRVEIRRQLLRRLAGLNDFLLGLGYLALDDPARAVSNFESAAAKTEGASGGEAVTNLFLGHAAGQSDDLDLAERSYESALRADPDYGRARFGLAEVAYQRASHGCKGSDVDVAGLQRALAGYRRATQSVAGDIDEATLNAKAGFGIGRVYLCLSQAGTSSDWRRAMDAFSRVIQAYDDGNELLTQYAAESYANQGLIRVLTRGAGGSDDDLLNAVTSYERAIELSGQDERDAVFYGMIGFAYEQMGRPDDAQSAYERAVKLTDDANLRTSYADSLERLSP